MVTCRANIHGLLNRGIFVYYNITTGSFHKRKHCSRLFNWSWIMLLKKTKNSLFDPITGNVRSRTPSVARWKAQGRHPIRQNWTVFCISYSWDVISRNRSKSAHFEGARGGSFWMQIWDGRGVAHQPLLVSENYGNYTFMWYQNIRSALFGFVTKHACARQADAQTDRHAEYDS